MLRDVSHTSNAMTHRYCAGCAKTLKSYEKLLFDSIRTMADLVSLK